MINQETENINIEYLKRLSLLVILIIKKSDSFLTLSFNKTTIMIITLQTISSLSTNALQIAPFVFILRHIYQSFFEHMCEYPLSLLSYCTKRVVKNCLHCTSFAIFLSFSQKQLAVFCIM